MSRQVLEKGSHVCALPLTDKKRERREKKECLCFNTQHLEFYSTPHDRQSMWLCFTLPRKAGYEVTGIRITESWKNIISRVPLHKQSLVLLFPVFFFLSFHSFSLFRSIQFIYTLASVSLRYPSSFLHPNFTICPQCSNLPSLSSPSWLTR